jgi:hypothetical protein
MENRSNSAMMWILVVAIAVCLQVVFIIADCRNSATGTAIDFTKAYFLLDAGMDRYLCSELISDEASAATAYLRQKAQEARDRGFGKGMVRQMITHLETETIAQDSESATIHLEGASRTCIHPVFTWVAKLFRIGQTHHFEETIDLVKEGGRWKVCGTPFGLSLDG